ncbi:MAG: glycosyltransferase family 9 protein [Candidatus Krumholzibacteriota bacterium]|nr:glycosyltransferase family 9 protein [Candidatus Krumholzibacteriota bacterium]
MKTLVIRFGSLGDVVLTLPALRDAALAGGPVHYLVHGSYASLLAPLPEVDRVWTLPRGAGTVALRSLASRLAAEGFETVLDLHASPRSRALRVLLARDGARCAATRRQDLRRRLWVLRGRLDGRLPAPPAAAPAWRRHRDAARRLLGGAYREASESPYPVPGYARQRAEAALAAAGLPADTAPVGLAPGARWPEKAWPRFAELAARLAGRIPLLVLGGPGEEALCADLAGDGGAALAGDRPLPETAAALACCRVLVTGDSGLGHLAEAAGTPVLALFGPTVPAFGFAPRLPASRVLERPLACRPCSLHGEKPCRLGTRACLAGIDADAALDALAAMGALP